MKIFGFLVLCLVMGITAFMSFTYLSSGGTSPSPGLAFKWQSDDMTMTIRCRKLQGNGDNPRTDEGDSSKNINLEDYRPIDPVPSAKASIRPSPIEHGTPLMPYIPKPSPPPMISSKNGLP